MAILILTGRAVVCLLVIVSIAIAIAVAVDSSLTSISDSRDAGKTYSVKGHKSKRLYRATALNFLQAYGLKYKLFNVFGVDVNVSDQSLGVDNYNISVNARFNETDLIHHRFQVYDHSAYTSHITTCVNPHLEYFNQIDYYGINSNLSRSRINDFNNQFRFGNHANARFFSIEFDKDPWSYVQRQHATLANNSYRNENGCDTSLESPPRVVFIGTDTSFHTKSIKLFCLFNHPNFTESELVNVIIEGDFAAIRGDDIISCSIPSVILNQLSKPSSHFISLDLLTDLRPEIPSHISPAQKLIKSGTETLLLYSMLESIQIPRDIPLNRREFNVAASTMVNDLESDDLQQWLVFNIMLGIQHFYLFDNSASKSNCSPSSPAVSNNQNNCLSNLTKSRLKPFLDANVITLIYYPYLPTTGVGWEHQIQRSSMNLAIKKYQSYVQWLGTYDIDEYFLPTNDTWQYFNPGKTLGSSGVKTDSFVYDFILKKFCDEKAFIPDTVCLGILFDSREKSCYTNETSSSYSGSTASLKPSILTCLFNGLHFVQLTDGHGKMFIRPSRVDYLMSPHSLISDRIAESSGLITGSGVFQHMNGAKYTRQYLSSDDEYVRERLKLDSFVWEIDRSLRDFTLLGINSFLRK